MPKIIHVLAFANVQVLDVTGPLQVFASANDLARQQGLPLPYAVNVIAAQAEPVMTSAGLALVAEPLPGADTPCDTLVIAGGWGVYGAAEDPQLVEWVRQKARHSRRMTSVCTGAFLLAASGLLDGKEATTYWRFFDEFKQRFPSVRLNQDKHLTDADNLFCAGGPVSACDLYIHLIERFCGAHVAQAVSRDTLYEVQRSYAPGRIGFGGQKLHRDVPILHIQQWLEAHYAEKFRFEDVARERGMSIRNFMRRFHAATGDKPLHYLQRLRIETAKGLLSGTRKSVKTISYEVGYDDASFFARLFRQHTELSPNGYRQQFMQVVQEV